MAVVSDERTFKAMAAALEEHRNDFREFARSQEAKQGAYSEVAARINDIHINVLEVKSYVKHLQTLPLIARSLTWMSRFIGTIALLAIVGAFILVFLDRIDRSSIKSLSVNAGGGSIERYENR